MLVHPRTIRRFVLAICVSGIAGMIATQIAERNNATIAFGLLTSSAVLVLLAVTSVTERRNDPPRVDDAAAAALEAEIQALLASGAPEPKVRAVVQAAIRLGRSST